MSSRDSRVGWSERKYRSGRRRCDIVLANSRPHTFSHSYNFLVWATVAKQLSGGDNTIKEAISWVLPRGLSIYFTLSSVLKGLLMVEGIEQFANSKMPFKLLGPVLIIYWMKCCFVCVISLR